eukprot:GHUV01002323.1.p1 GENE.GHUV01002323.1~~GHUV01002323.1.p1  ORF type:complete len:211 (+),score=69.98 GHUV01002323.1:124-756(+)
MESHDKILQEIPKGHVLRHVEQINDRSKPAIDADTHLKKWDKDGLLKGIEAGVPLKHVDTDDRGKPVIAPDVHIQPSHHKELLQEVRAAAAHSALVREVHAVSDAAGAGDGDEDVTHSPLVAQLHHVETDDKGKPVITADTHVQKWDKEGFLQEVASPHDLHHVDPSQIADRSAPAVPADAHVGESPAVAVLKQISEGEVPELRHVEAPQ